MVEESIGQRIPTLQGIAFWEQRVTFDGSDYRLYFAWNDRAHAWFMSLRNLDGDDIVSSIKIVCNRFLFKKHHWNPDTPPGQVICIDPKNQIDVPQFFDLNIRAVLLYLDVATLLSLDE
jgi:uncharacterized protein DUF6983